MSVFSKWASTMPLRYDMVKLTFLRSSVKARGRSLKLSCSWTRKVRSLVVSVPLKGSGSQTFEQEPSPWCCTFLANAAIASAKLCWTFSSSGWSESSDGSKRSPGPSSFPSSDRSLLGLPGPSSSGSLSPGGCWSSVGPSEAVWELWITAGVVVDMRLPNAIPELVPEFLEFQVVRPIVFIVQVVIIEGSEFRVRIYCYESYCRRVVGQAKYILPRGSYQVRSESELESKSKWDNYQKTIQLPLMCCAPWILSSSQFTRGWNRLEWGKVIREGLQGLW